MTASFFSTDYAEARQKFLAACARHGGQVVTYAHPLTGPARETLAADVIRVGPADADRLLVVSSATHGVEGFCGSGALIGFLTSGFLPAALPPGVAMLLVHAINPHGFAHIRRVTEDNVDLNRNFRDHATPPPANEAYAEVHRWLLPAEWDGPGRQEADAAIARYVQERGQFAFQAAVSGGQYQFPDGLFYGGARPTWSNDTLRAIVARFAVGHARVGFIDFHTGLGPRGYGEPIFIGQPGGDEHARARAWYGDQLTAPGDGQSASALVQGTVVDAFAPVAAAGGQFTGMALEYGTQPVMDVLDALRADHWLHLHGEAAPALRRQIKQQIRDAFYQDADDWKAQVWARAQEMAQRALDGLAA
jgi:hypothetical protein